MRIRNLYTKITDAMIILDLLEWKLNSLQESTIILMGTSFSRNQSHQISTTPKQYSGWVNDWALIENSRNLMLPRGSLLVIPTRSKRPRACVKKRGFMGRVEGTCSMRNLSQSNFIKYIKREEIFRTRIQNPDLT